ncbi:MAG: hypothetical protein WC322_06475, partial [Candidatus Paceibacterota bacterium]
MLKTDYFELDWRRVSPSEGGDFIEIIFTWEHGVMKFEARHNLSDFVKEIERLEVEHAGEIFFTIPIRSIGNDDHYLWLDRNDTMAHL